MHLKKKVYVKESHLISVHPSGQENFRHKEKIYKNKKIHIEKKKKGANPGFF